jgi:outer membrane protein assembly factor BamB
VLNESSVAGHDPATGRVLWNYDWSRSAPTVAVPIILSEDRVLLSVGYGIGSRVLQIAREGENLTATLVWESPRLKAKFTNPVLYDGFVYGLDDGVLVCLDPATGERRWRSGRYGHGQTLLVGNRLLVTTEDGDVVLVEPTPEAHRELTRFTAFSQKLWNPPALAGRYLLVRTDTEAACYEL